MIDRAAIRALMPHAQRMCLVDTVASWDRLGIRCTTDSHRDPENPLRSGDRLAALHLCEYGAQAMAIHGGLLAGREGGAQAAPGGPAAAGMVAALREVDFAVDRIDDIPEPLTIAATVKIAGAGGCIYEFEVSAAGRWLARGRVSVMSG